MLKSPCICTTFSRFNIFDEKKLKMLKMLKFSIFWYKKLSPAAPVTPPYSMYYIFRFWGKLKSLISRLGRCAGALFHGRLGLKMLIFNDFS